MLQRRCFVYLTFSLMIDTPYCSAIMLITLTIIRQLWNCFAVVRYGFWSGK